VRTSVVSTQYIVETRNGNVTVVVLNDRFGHGFRTAPGDHLTLSWDPESHIRRPTPMEEAEK